MRRVFFSFHYERDVRRAAVVRNSQRFLDRDEWQFLDGVEWEEVRKTSDLAIKRWINKELKYTSVTVVLIGAKTSERKWVDYEIQQSLLKNPKNGLLGIRLDAVKDMNTGTETSGDPPWRMDGFPVYRWVPGTSETRVGAWLEKAARDAGR